MQFQLALSHRARNASASCRSPDASGEPEGVDVGEDQPEHVPVLARELVEAVAAGPGQVVVDGTFGAGGHARLIAPHIAPGGHYVGIDRDPGAAVRFERFAVEVEPLGTRFERMPFPDAFSLLAGEGVSADAVILDVGVSSMHIDDPGRGFSYMQEGPLDMRMDPTSGEDAAHLLATAGLDELARIFREYGEEAHARRIARAIVDRRASAPLRTTTELAGLVARAVPSDGARRGHPAKRVFQALRIAVNDELGMLDRGLDAALALLCPGGRLVVISFHSLEDRMVKRRFADWVGRCSCPPGLPVCGCGAHALVEAITRKAVKPSQQECERNPRASSARLRAVRKLEVAS